MDVYFDGCLEELLKEIIERSPKDVEGAEALLQALPAFREECMRAGGCPLGEFKRSSVCRHYLRDAAKRMEDRLKAFDEDAAIRRIMDETRGYIEHIGDETEAERAYIVIRNLTIIAENIAIRERKKKSNPLDNPKDSVRLIHYRIEDKGIREFAKIAGFTIEPLNEELPKLKLSPMTSAREACKTRYRHIFFNTAVRAIECREKSGPSRSKERADA